jgi:endogenous inhibitor of DNA gyrase (YacG/DUF329 family)
MRMILMATVTCPTCGKAFDPAQSPAMPFCSQRCRSIDLNRWLTEEISMPYRETEEANGSDREEHREEDN